ncbi:MAG: cytochrome c oxidase subunit II [Gemmatimonadota bacterium]
MPLLRPEPRSGATVPRRRRAWVGPVGAAFLAAACAGPQSTLSPAGTDAEQIAMLWWWMAGGAAFVWCTVVGIAVYAIWIRPAEHDRTHGVRLILVGGVVFPTVVLAALLAYGLSILPRLLLPGESDGLRIEVVGEEWWWRVRYLEPGQEAVESANEVRLPVGRRTTLTLTSADVIHSFWVPALAGKIDMIPGRTNRIALEPTRTGIFRGACAEFCGTSHALMGFRAVVMEPDEFSAWLARERRPAAGAEPTDTTGGARIFRGYGCGACHTVRGVSEMGTVGPDLTHVGSRVSLAAGMLPNDSAAFHTWIASSSTLKPDVHMPAFSMLTPTELGALAAWLERLQ